MPSRLSRYAAGVIEAAWLAAVIVVPIFFNIYSSRIFEPDKITLLRTLALITLAAWLTKIVDDGLPDWRSLQGEDGWLRSFLRVPLLAPVAALALVYILSTALSVSPYTSFWGSYQRLQGAYTLFSYLVIFAAMAAHLRRRAQVERLITAIILTSLPVSMYGVLQRRLLDPIPWGGDTAARIASNMGNSIFVAAYLIMVFPLTLMRIVETFEALMKERGHNGANFACATLYLCTIALECAALYFSFSRGPWLGWGASLVVIWLGLAFIWRKRWMTLSGVALAVIAAIFLVTLNIPNGPLEGLRSLPQMGRLGQLFDAESRTGRVRTLIWQGAYELVRPHAPLEYPDGRKDALNFLRPLIGYGPESMYVAYNRFYQPELTQVEKRNASPDRSHNETWDSLVFTGLLGLVVYLFLFGSIIYYGLKWLGMIAGERQRNLFLALYVSGGIIASIVFYVWRGPAYLGVALPAGMVFGVLLYFIAASLQIPAGEGEQHPDQRLRAYLLLGLTAAIVAHFIEVNFGIAIAATRAYFFVDAALILLVGLILPRKGIYQTGEITDAQDTPPAGGDEAGDLAEKREQAVRAATRKKRSAGRGAPVRETAARQIPEWLRAGLETGLLVSLLLGTLGFLYVSNISRSASAALLVVSSFTGQLGETSTAGILALVIATWVVSCVLLASETMRTVSRGEQDLTIRWIKTIVTALVVSLALSLLYWLWHAALLAQLNSVTATNVQMVLEQVQRSENLLTRYYVFLLAVVLGLAASLVEAPSLVPFRSPASVVAGCVALLAAVWLIGSTNLRVIQADIAFKTGDIFARPGSWPVSVQVYSRARDLSPNEDYYYLFLGRAYLEYAKTLEASSEREQLISQASKDLLEAQRINPLNTDHTANLARLYSLWSGFSDDAAIKAQRAEIADQYFSQAVRLSPQSARIWDEWAVHVMNNMNDPRAGLEHLQQALAIDPYYDWTFGLLGDYYSRFESTASGVTPEKRVEILIQAADYYTKAVSLMDPANPTQGYGYLVSYGTTQSDLGNTSKAIDAYLRAMAFWPENPELWRVEAAIAQLYARQGDNATALKYAQEALAKTPEDQRGAVEELIKQFSGQS